MGENAAVLHLFLVNSIGGDTVVFLLETEPGVVEFPRLQVGAGEIDDEDALRERITTTIGVQAELSGFLDPPDGAPLEPAGSRILLARYVAGSPRVALQHIGWEWTPGTALVQMPFAPKLMVDELKSFMNI